MLRTIASTTRQASITRRAHPGWKPASLKHAFGPCARPSGLPDRLAASRQTPASSAMYGRRHYSQISEARHNAAGQARSQTLPDRQQIIDSIAHQRAPSPYAPQTVDFKKAAALYPESTQARVKSLDRLISEAAPAAQRVPVRSEGTGTLLTAFDALAAADKVFLCTGANSAQGKVELDGPVGTAVLAYALYQAGKVAMVVADRTNCRLVQEVLEKLDPDCARHLRYIHIQGVNGVLVDAMYKLLQRHQPQAVVHVGVAGRTRDGLYLDAQGAYIGEYNMALDQMMDLANALEKPTIAIGTGPHQAGLGGDTDAARHTLQAQHQILAGSVSQGALAVAELLAAAYAGGHACTPELLKTMMKLARECRDKPEYKVRLVREGSTTVSKSPRAHQNSNPVYAELADKALQYASLTGLARIHDSVHGTQIAWPQQIEEARLYGRTCRYVILVDSSAGGRLAALPFRNFFRARSSMDIKTLCLSDDAEAPYGTKPDEVRQDRVYRMLRHASRQGAEVIVMMCNTACLEDLNSMKRQIEAEAAAEGRKLVVHIIDLIETTAHAIIERGGARPVLLSTEATKKKGKYPEMILEFSQGNAEQPKVLVIAAGDDGNPELKHMDWPTLVNKGYHRKNQTAAVKAMVRREVRRYAEQIPLDSTSVWLVCTHFPALKELIDEILAERLREAGYTHKIPVYDPVADQADALIAWTVDFPPTDKTAFAHLPDFAVHTTAPVIDIIDSVAEILTPETVVTKVDFDERKPSGPSGPSSRNPPDRKQPAKAPAQANAATQSTASPESQEIS